MARTDSGLTAPVSTGIVGHIVAHYAGALALLTTLISLPAAAQVAALRGTVTDSATGLPVYAARLEIIGPAPRSTITDERGRFALERLAAGVYRVTIARVGYRPRVFDALDVPADGAMLDVTLAAAGVPLDPVVVTASRNEQSALDAPAAVSVVGRLAIEETPALTTVEHVRAVPGMDIASKGLIQRTFTVRGVRSVSSGSMLLLSDYRYAALPAIGFNIGYLLAATSEDVDRIEVLRGPGAALYGPGASRGVLHVLTRSPFESPGGIASVGGGERSVLQGSLRYAGHIGTKLAFKLSGDFIRGRDWAFTDSAEAAERATAIARGASADTLRIGRREPDVERAGGEARLDWRPDARTEVVTTVGVAQAMRVIDMAPALGSVQGRDWRYSFAQTRVQRGRFFANVLYNWSDAGDTYLLRTGAPLVDDSRVIVAQAQHGAAIRAADVLYGADFRWTNPRTGGTIHGLNEADDLVAEAGGYAHASISAGPRVDLIGALRVDHHNRLNDLVVSPRVGVVFKPAPAHALRLTYNRAFSSPDANDLFLDIAATRIALPGGFGYTVRAVGVPKDGYTFRRDCDGRLCMRSPFNLSGGSSQYLPADVTVLWPAVVAFAQQLGVDLSGIPAPTSAEVGTNLAALGLGGAFTPIAAGDVTDIAGEGREITNTIEAGYKGLLGGRVRVEVDAWFNRVSDLAGALVAGTPNAFFDRTTLEAYLSGYLPAAEAAQLADTISQVPAGTISPQETAYPVDILLLNRRGGAYSLFGVDLGIEVALNSAIAVDAAYSWVSNDSIPNIAQVGTVLLNVPRHKGSIGLTWRADGAGVMMSVRGRALSAFRVASGLYSGLVESYGVLDVMAAYRLPLRRDASITVSAQNVLDHHHQEFVASPAIGRLVVARLRVEF